MIWLRPHSQTTPKPGCMNAAKGQSGQACAVLARSHAYHAGLLASLLHPRGKSVRPLPAREDTKWLSACRLRSCRRPSLLTMSSEINLYQRCSSAFMCAHHQRDTNIINNQYCAAFAWQAVMAVEWHCISGTFKSFPSARIPGPAGQL